MMRGLSVREVATLAEAASLTGLDTRRLQDSDVPVQGIAVLSLGSENNKVATVIHLGGRNHASMYQSRLPLFPSAIAADIDHGVERTRDGRTIAWADGLRVRSDSARYVWQAGGTVGWESRGEHFLLQSADVGPRRLLELAERMV